VLAYLSLYTHRIAISNSRLLTFDDTGVTFRWKDYRANGRDRAKVMTLAIDEFIRRFLIHALPGGFHRIRHYGLFANAGRADNIAQVRQLLDIKAAHTEPGDAGSTDDAEPHSLPHPCPRERATSCFQSTPTGRAAASSGRRGALAIQLVGLFHGHRQQQLADAPSAVHRAVPRRNSGLLQTGVGLSHH
jgi:hypothetical protein